VIPHAMGQDLSFTAGEGPRLAPPLQDSSLSSLREAPERLDPIYETVRRVAAALPPQTTFLGFAGAPWTVATYMVAGEGSKDHAAARIMAYRDPTAFAELIERIVEMTVTYLCGQIDAGVHAVQLFESWSGSLAPDQFERWVIEPTRSIVRAVKQLRPGIPIIGFPKGAGGKLRDYADATGVDVIGIDETVDPLWADAVLPPNLPVQGNLDPLALLVGGEALEKAVHRIRQAFAGRPHVFNLGHGILPQVPIDHVETLLKLVRA